jgi:hypothetical protein
MTNEDIERKAHSVFYSESGAILALADVEERVAVAMREAVLQAYEEAARAECDYCSKSVPMPVEKFGNFQRYKHRLDPDEEPYISEAYCDAPSVRALKDSLVAETVSSI